MSTKGQRQTYQENLLADRNQDLTVLMIKISQQ